MSDLNGRRVLEELGQGVAYRVAWCFTHHSTATFSTSKECPIGVLWHLANSEGITKRPATKEECRVGKALVIEPVSDGGEDRP